MRRLAAAVVLAGLLWPASAVAEERWQPDVAGAAAWASARQGSVTFAVRTGDRLAGRGLDRQFPSASVIKAMLLVTYLRQTSVRDRPLDAGEKALLAPMIRRSDNIAATRVRDIVGNPAIVSLARRAGNDALRHPPPLGPLADHGARPDTVLPRHREPAAGPPPRLRAAAPAHDRAVAAVGHGAGDPGRLGAVLQGRMGIRHRRRRPPGRAARPRRASRRDRRADSRQPVARVRQGDAARRVAAPAPGPRAAGARHRDPAQGSVVSG